MITYADFQPGELLGRSRFTLEAPVIEAWRRLFPADDHDGVMPHGMAAVISMRAYVDVVPDRPPGNVHAAQRFELLRLPRVGEVLVTIVSCLEKEIRRERRRVTLTTETTGDEGPTLRGRMTVLWAR